MRLGLGQVNLQSCQRFDTPGDIQGRHHAVMPIGGHADDRSILAMMLFTTDCTKAAAIRHGSWRRVGRRQTGYRHPPRLKRAAIVLEDDSGAEETRWTLADRAGQEGGGRAVVWSSYFAKLPKKLLTE